MFVKLMMFTCINLMLMVGVLAIIVHSKGLDESNSNDFELPCEAIRVTTALWDTFAGLDYEPEEKVELGRKIEEIFFSSMSNVDGKGNWNLPERFGGDKPKRSEVCTSSSSTRETPSASESLASAIFRLCTSTNEDEDLCGLKVGGIGKCADEGVDVRVTFTNVWGDYYSNGVMNRCGGTDSSSMEGAKNNLSKAITKIESVLKKRHIRQE
ncbi:unnamed protein product [Trypanosoma congolense IL3000]|uniref:WGS project CAEQ00000000 data, annotated contig 301 n=1 Tax=Trypanosoma congolense (strain IL3000) TaxID=1068625 RepID=F9WEQ2_TRYCI|nr:unnamed protein product [Trypanosoma congolense IL3000]